MSWSKEESVLIEFEDGSTERIEKGDEIIILRKGEVPYPFQNAKKVKTIKV